MSFTESPPQPATNEQIGGKFIERCGIDGDEDRLDAMGEAHSPRVKCVGEQMHRFNLDAIAAIAGEKASNAADTLADGGSRGGQIESAQHADLRPPALEDQRAGAEEEPAEPGESSRLPQCAPAQIVKLDGVVDNVPQLGADDANHNGDGYHAEGVGGDACAVEAAVHDEGGYHGSQPEHQPKGGDGIWNGDKPDVDRRVKNVQIGNHRFSSIDGRGRKEHATSRAAMK